MSIRKIDTAISTIRSLYDENGNYLPSGNYYFSIKDYEKGVFTGDMASSGEFGEFTFSPKKLIKMMAVSQSRLARRAGLQREEGMPSYPSPLARNCGSRLSHFTTTSSYVVRNYSSENVVLREEPSTCSICFEKINRCDKKSLNCNHDFHRNCINTWLREQNNCPLCRASQSTEESTTRLDPLREAINELRTVTSNRNRLYNQLTNRDYTTRRNNRTVVFPRRK